MLASDQTLLDSFRRSFNPALQTVLEGLRRLGLAPTERIKTTFSIVQMLKRESIRLSRLQERLTRLLEIALAQASNDPLPYKLIRVIQQRDQSGAGPFVLVLSQLHECIHGSHARFRAPAIGQPSRHRVPGLLIAQFSQAAQGKPADHILIGIPLDRFL